MATAIRDAVCPPGFEVVRLALAGGRVSEEEARDIEGRIAALAADFRIVPAAELAALEAVADASMRMYLDQEEAGDFRVKHMVAWWDAIDALVAHRTDRGDAPATYVAALGEEDA